ncbi:I-set and/or fn3 domain containing protein [Asbolus verrucosus]|uniref:I-set and/or fn3 domain containing protein n=1 Tax=Asbolus verrucosus TaxID=1661398 RepID=A0A482VZK0_ASBVE|nr:I-set and/or fn3 domain containing protein [Asbolus verrucosus]
MLSRLNYHPEKGIYDLLISNASYDRDNGKFECKVKAGGSGENLHVQRYTLTVLTAPQEPAIAPGSQVIVTEGKRQELTCSSVGGSPDPEVKWYREGSMYPLEAALKNGGSRDQPTTATLSIVPAKDDDEAVFRCEVWNRALPEKKKLISTVSLSVNYFPRVEVGPENPLRVERDSQATLQCSVDAKPKVSSVRWTRNGRFISTYTSHVIHRVSIQDAGKYTCSADNGLGKVGEKEITLDVLYAPIVSLEAKTKEAEEGESVYIKCNVTANPSPVTVEWVKDGKPDFRQSGDTLRLSHVSAENSGTYICRAVNIISPSSVPLRRNEKIGNASIALLIRHKPGKARIMPDKPVATEGSAVTLTCTATPPGWPAPQYRWFRRGNSGESTILATGTKYTIANANLGTEGTYNCQATNELGPGEMASVDLEVHQPPSFKYQLKPLETKRVGDPNFSMTCSAKGKPKPMVKWLKDNEELTADVNMYEVKTDYSESHNSAVNVQSVLKFSGKARPNGNELLPSDRGIYTCSFENEVKKSESSMHLKIEHEPIVLHQYNKVAYDISETAEVVCKVLAYPKPEFKWFYGSNLSPLQSSSEGHYVIHTNVEEDTFTSILKISNIKKQDYGEYNCQIINNLGQIEAKIRLQPKGPPEKPTKLVSLHTGPNYVTLGWEPGFNGGISNTKYFVSYKKVPSEEDVMIEGCGTVTKSTDWSEVDCQQNVPCNVSHLDQHQTYLFKVKALNTKGNSEHSQEIRLITRVDRIPLPQRVAYDPSSHTLSINIPITCLPLVAVIESFSNENHPPKWQIIDTIPLQISGISPTYKEANLDQMGRNYKAAGRSLVDEPIGVNDNYTPRVRVKLCLRTRQEHCSDFAEAEFSLTVGSAYIREASALATPTLIAIVVSCIVFVLFVGLLLIFCRCKRNQSKKSQAKDYEMDSVRPTIIPQQNQAPPPYYPSTGMENKALEHSLDLALAMEDQKNVYATQNGYGYHVANPDIQGRQNITNNDWANMGYLENSYSNSNNGGSVNSQDSLWQMKMAAASTNSTNQLQPHHINVDRQNSYGYDPITHGGYGAVDDYAPYPHITTQSNHGDDYMRNSNNPSRQDYCSDPYAAVHKPKKRIEQHIDSPYHDVSGLPDPYLEQMEDEKPPQHMSLSYEESLESGYSTPNSRTRRVIREIIV